MNVTPLLKGLITGLLMVASNYLLVTYKTDPGSILVYLSYMIFAAGIGWTLYGYAKSPEYKAKFGDIFAQGFRCFVIITLVIVVYTAIFAHLHPEMAERDAEYGRQALIAEKNKTPAEIEKMVQDFKDGYITSLIARSIFSTLLVGSIMTAAGAAFLLMRRRQ